MTDKEETEYLRQQVIELNKQLKENSLLKNNQKLEDKIGSMQIKYGQIINELKNIILKIRNQTQKAYILGFRACFLSQKTPNDYLHGLVYDKIIDTDDTESEFSYYGFNKIPEKDINLAMSMAEPYKISYNKGLNGINEMIDDLLKDLEEKLTNQAPES